MPTLPNRAFQWKSGSLILSAFFAKGLRFVCAIVCLVLVVLAPCAKAQLYTGSVTGMVIDPSGAMIASAEIQVVDQAKGFSFNAVTDTAGRYLVRQLPPGTYRIRAAAPGFQTQLKENINLAVNENISVNFALRVGAVAETVEVRTGAVELETQDAVSAQTVDRKWIDSLPLISRSVFDLAFLAPGVTQPDNQCPGCTATNFISNGSRNSTADVLMDGVSASNFEQNSGIMDASYVPSVEAVQEFKVQQSNFSAEFGFSGATVVNLVTRSGTNAYHGSVYEFLRNDVLDANDWFANHNGEPRSPLRHNNFGVTFGGPIRKNKTFFFFDYDGTRQRTFASGSAGVPTQAERAGNFGELCTLRGGSFDGSGRCSVEDGQLWDPYDPNAAYDANLGGPVRTAYVPFNNLATYASAGTANPNQIGNLIDPAAMKLMKYFPDPTKSLSSIEDRFDNWYRSGTNKWDNNQFDIKIDHSFSERSLLSARYSQLWRNSHDFNCFGNMADPCTSGPTNESAHLFAVNETYTFNPKLVLNVSYGYTRRFSFTHSIKGDYPNLDPVQQLGMPGYMDVAGYPQFPSIILPDYVAPGPDGSLIGTQTYSYMKYGTDTHHLLGTASWQHGLHELKIGGEGRLHRINFGQPGYPGGQFNFDYSGSSQFPNSGGGDPMASFLMGVGSFGNCGWCPYEVANFVSTQNFQFGTFIQDNYRVRPNLTVNLGLRYDVSLPRTERYNRMNWIDLNMVNPLNGGNIPGLGTLHGGEVFTSSNNRYNFGTDWHDIQPRVGFAWRLPHDLVMRGGYGIYFSIPRSGAAGTGPVNTYRGYDQFTQWITVDPSNGATPFARFSNPFPSGGPLLPPGNTLGALNDVGFDGAGALKTVTDTPNEQTWSFGFEKELPWKVLLGATYLGKKGTHLYFGGTNDFGLNYLGAWVEKLTPAQIGALNEYVPNPFYGYIKDPNSTLSSETVQAFQLLRPYPQYTNFAPDVLPIASSTYHGLQLRAQKAYANGLQFLVTYTWSKSIDDSSTTSSDMSWLGGMNPPNIQDPNRLYLERSVSTWDIPHQLQFSYVYALPFGRGRTFGSGMNSILNAFLGGWQINGTWRITSGRPILLTLDGGEAIPTYGGRRPNLSGNLQRNNGPDWINNYFSNGSEVLSQPPDYTLGDAPRAITSARTPGVNNATMSLFKEFSLASIREGMRLEYRLETFNTFNHPQFCGPDTSVRFESGQITGNFGQVTEMCNSAREVQMALKFYF